MITATPVGNIELNKATIGPPEVLRSARHLKINKEGNTGAFSFVFGMPSHWTLQLMNVYENQGAR